MGAVTVDVQAAIDLAVAACELRCGAAIVEAQQLTLAKVPGTQTLQGTVLTVNGHQLQVALDDGNGTVVQSTAAGPPPVVNDRVSLLVIPNGSVTLGTIV